MKCIIVEDGPIARKGMKRLITSREELELVGMYDNPAEAMKAVDEMEVELIFLDIEMPGITGIEFARNLPDDIMVVFTTAYSEYAVESYALSALDYLVKPIDPERFNIAVDKALEKSRQRLALDLMDHHAMAADGFLTVKADRRFIRIRMEDILYVEGNKDFVVFHLSDREVESRATVKSIEKLLPATKFIRINKSYIVNIDRIDSFDSNDIMIGRRELSIGATYRDALFSRLLP